MTTADQFAGAFIIIFLIAICYEALRFWREKLYNDYQAQQQITCSNPKELAPPRKTLGYANRHIISFCAHKFHPANNLYCFRRIIQAAFDPESTSDTNINAYDTGGCIVRINVNCHDIQCMARVSSRFGSNSGILSVWMDPAEDD